jgi:predicted Zn-dependent peptidase
VRTSATDSALVEALREYRRIVQEPVPVEELRGFVNNLAASFPSSTQTVQELRTRLQNLELWGLPLDFYETYRERLTALTPSDIQAAARRHFTPDRALVVIAGDLSRIEDAIRGRNLGEVEIWDMEGNRIH